MPSSRSRSRLALFALAPAAIAIVLVLVGVEIGRRSAVKDASRAIEAHASNETLGAIVDVVTALQDAGRSAGQGAVDARVDFSLAYLDPERAAREMGSYSFAVPMVPTPFVGHAPAPGVHANATISQQQFRHASELVTPKPPGVRRVFITGGSTAFGAGAPSQQTTITGYLQALLDETISPRAGIRYEIVNAAAPAWASTHERIWISQRLSELEPDLVISFSGVNDVHWGALGREVDWFRSYTDQHYFDLLNLLRAEVGLEALVDVTYRAEGRVAPETIARNLLKNARLSAAVLALREVPYLFVLQPMIGVTAKPLSEREKRRRSFSLLGPGINAYFEEAFAAIRERLGAAPDRSFHFADLTGVFDSAGADAEIFLDSYHFGDRGNQLLARALFRSMLPLLAEARR